MTISSEVVVITPELAQELIDSKPEFQRNVREKKVAAYARDIAAGQWKLNGEPIIIDDKNRLIDGQHRCAAVIKAGKPMTTFLIRGVAADSYKTIDSGLGRKLSDVFKGTGINACDCTIGKNMCACEAVGGITFDPSTVVSTTDSADFIDANIDSIRPMRLAYETARKNYLNLSAAGFAIAMWGISARHGEETMAAFRDEFIKGPYSNSVAIVTAFQTKSRRSDEFAGGGVARKKTVQLILWAFEHWVDDDRNATKCYFANVDLGRYGKKAIS